MRHGGHHTAPAARLPAPHSAGRSRFGSESVRRDLRDTSDFRDQQRPGAAAANGHAALATSEHGGSGDPDVRDQAIREQNDLLAVVHIPELVMTMLLVT